MACTGPGPPPGSLGLGLFICKQIAQAQAGDIEVQSEGREVRFTMTWPAEADDAVQP